MLESALTRNTMTSASATLPSAERRVQARAGEEEVELVVDRRNAPRVQHADDGGPQRRPQSAEQHPDGQRLDQQHAEQEAPLRPHRAQGADLGHALQRGHDQGVVDDDQRHGEDDQHRHVQHRADHGHELAHEAGRLLPVHRAQGQPGLGARGLDVPRWFARMRRGSLTMTAAFSTSPRCKLRRIVGLREAILARGLAGQAAQRPPRHRPPGRPQPAPSSFWPNSSASAFSRDTSATPAVALSSRSSCSRSRVTKP